MCHQQDAFGKMRSRPRCRERSPWTDDGLPLRDKRGRPLRKHIFCSDWRSVAEEKVFIAKAGEDEIYDITELRASASYSATKFMWVRDHEPDVDRFFAIVDKAIPDPANSNIYRENKKFFEKNLPHD